MSAATSYDPYDERPIAGVARAGVARRVSWGAIIAGVVVIWAVQFLLGLLGLGIGMTTIDPASGDTPRAAALGGGAALWWIGASLISVFVGGVIAGRLSGAIRKSDGMLHGFVAWCAATLVLLYLMTTGVSVLVGGAFRTVGTALSAVGQTAAQGAEAAADSGPGREALQGIQRQARELMNRAASAVGAAAGQPATPGQEASAPQAATQGQPGTQGQPMPQMQTQAGPMDDVYRLLRRGAAPVSEADRQNAVRIIAQQTGQTEEQARATLDRWQREYQETMANAERQAREAAEKTAKTLAQGSLWAFLALVIGAICAAIGGSLGARRDLSHY